jgi:hypothetical protein
MACVDEESVYAVLRLYHAGAGQCLSAWEGQVPVHTGKLHPLASLIKLLQGLRRSCCFVLVFFGNIKRHKSALGF